MKLLLENGANIDAADESNETALMWSAKAGHTALVEVGLGTKSDLMLSRYLAVSFFVSITSLSGTLLADVLIFFRCRGSAGQWG